MEKSSKTTEKFGKTMDKWNKTLGKFVENILLLEVYSGKY